MGLHMESDLQMELQICALLSDMVQDFNECWGNPILYSLEIWHVTKNYLQGFPLH